MAVSNNEDFARGGGDPLARFAVLADEALRRMAQEEMVAVPRRELQAAVNRLKELGAGPRPPAAPDERDTVSIEEAANFLMVPPEFVEGLLDNGEVPFYQKGPERRIPFGLLTEYDSETRQGQEKALNFISQEFKEMGLHDYFERT